MVNLSCYAIVNIGSIAKKARGGKPLSKSKSVLVVAAAIMMTLSSATFGITGTAAAELQARQPITMELEKPALNLPDQFVNPEDPNKKVRIIVELEKAPTIDAATSQGVLYKSLPDSQKKSLEAAVAKDQAAVQASILKVSPRITYFENFTTVFNGFSAEVEAGEVEGIANTTGVQAVYEATEYQRPEVQPEMKYSKDLVQAQEVWNDYGYTGEDMVVGVIDTGIDPSHKDMVLTDDATGEITKAEVDQLAKDGLVENGQYHTAKVPFGYNYMDGNNEILDLGPEASMHGMHVAGTVGANGDEENGGITGVAPEAQLLALKVFGNDPKFPSTYGDIYVKAIDDSIKLGADVINMSLGSTAGFVDTSNPEQKAVERATNNGILMSISAGNSDMFGSGYFYPYAENQDYALTGSPSVAVDSFGVASFENDIITAMSFGFDIGSGEERGLYLLANDKDPRDLPEASYEVMDAGFGTPADFAGKDFTGKVALVSRGSISFVEKGLNAQAAGAAAVIIYNNTTGTISMASDAAIKIPFMSALQEDGQAMKAALDAGTTPTVEFDGEFFEMKNPAAGEMSDFTSWGPTPNLDFKPEITAPGGNIFSTLNNDEYGLMSGTSMAAPHVAGGAALLFERMNELGLNGKDRVTYAKNLMMNTADVVNLEDNEFVSPRRQGAGLMSLHDALSTDVMLTDTATGLGKVALKEIKDGKFSFTLKAENFKDEDASYDVYVDLQTDNLVKGNLKANNPNVYTVAIPNQYGSQVITGDVEVDAPEKITVPANSTKEFTVTVDATALNDEAFYQEFVNGFFIDGFVSLQDPEEDVTGNPDLQVPFFGFNGEWDDASIFDDFTWDPMSFYGVTLLTDEKGNDITGGTVAGGYVPEKFAFSPNGDGSVDKALPVFSLMRNAKNMEVNVLDKDGKKLRTIATGKDLVKHYSTEAYYTFNPAYAWDGKVYGKNVTDGEYQIQLRAVIDFEGAEWQSIEFPIKVDTVKPEAGASFDTAASTVKVSSFTDNNDADRWEVFVNGKEVTETEAAKSLSPATKEYKVANVVKGDDVKAVFYDVAGNSTEVKLSTYPEETKEPVIFFTTPEVTSVHKTNKVEVKGTVEDDSKIVSLTVNGQEATLFDGKNFAHTLTLDDGVQYVTVKAVDAFGNEMELRREVHVDTKPAVVTAVDVPTKVKGNVDEVDVTFNVKDNFGQIVAYIYDDEVFRKDLTEPYDQRFNKNITTTVPVKMGKNEFKFVVKDLAGHVTEKTFTITKEKTTFSDIQNYWAKDQIETLATQGIINGQTDTLFGPNADLTRAQLAALLVRSLDLEVKDSTGTFSDVNSQTTWAYKEIEAAARAGIVKGDEKGKYNPNAPITREQAATMMIRAIAYEDASLLEGLDATHKFADQSKISSYALETVKQAEALGVFTGREGNMFDPQARITRGETAVVLYRSLDKLELLDNN